ncbi:MAG: galactokinase [Labilithrix sp.]|nr:galactokinase [Labilithrix sp.]
MSDFAEAFGRSPDVVAHAPGRVNLIGEHTDYSGGFVLPMAIPQRTTVSLAHRNDGRVRAMSMNVAQREPITFELGHERKQGSWIDYVQGTIVALRAAGHLTAGFDALIESAVPVGSGLSSSAALEVGLLRALRQAFVLDLADVALAKIGRAAETDFVGAPVGIMDQMASSLADAKNALFIDTRSLAYERVPLPTDVEIAVLDSGIAHDHAAGDYRTRRKECERAAELLGVRELRDVDDVGRTASLPAPLDRRARHVVTENARVLEAVLAMRENDPLRVGRLFDASHASLRDDFEVSVPGVDRLVALAQAHPDVLGARMTGGGFGGAIVALVRQGRAGEAAHDIARAYSSRHRGHARILVPEGKA